VFAPSPSPAPTEDLLQQVETSYSFSQSFSDDVEVTEEDDEDDEVVLTPTQSPTLAVSPTLSPTSAVVISPTPLPTSATTIISTTDDEIEPEDTSAPTLSPTGQPTISPTNIVEDNNIPVPEKDKKNDDDDEFWESNTFQVSAAGVGGAAILSAVFLLCVRSKNGVARPRSIETNGGGDVELGGPETAGEFKSDD
jgi:hypothetical protein